MDISVKITEKYKSIEACEFTLPEFCVLTGKNGSGKSHLLEAISSVLPRSRRINNTNQSYKISSVVYNGKDCVNIKLIKFGGLNPNIAERCNPNEITNFVNETYQLYTQDKSIINRNLSANDANSSKIDFLKYVIAEIKNSGGTEINESDLFSRFKPQFISQDELFSGKFAMIFKNYANIKEENEYKRFRKSQGKYNGVVLTDEEFRDTYGDAPSQLINAIFERVEIPYYVNNPEQDDRNAEFFLELHDKQNPETHIKCGDLSTGEKVLMSLAMAIYNSDTDSKKPDVLLIDEPDAGLHPSMSQKMVNVIKEFIVEKSRIPVIITTHNATTIAALDDVSIYEKRRDGKIPENVSKENALAILTSDIPFLTVMIENRREIFVESDYDASAFKSICEIFNDRLSIKPSFFPCRANKSGGSNCSDVINFTQKFYDQNNNRVYGIVDWDNDESRSTRNNLLILGNGERYAIENFLLDPLLVGILLILDGKTDNFTFLSQISTASISSFTADVAQNIANEILVKLNVKIENTVDCEYVGGMKLQLPKEFLNTNGHELEDYIYQIKIPCLNSYNNPNALMSAVVKRVVKDYRDFLPKAVLDTILQIR